MRLQHFLFQRTHVRFPFSFFLSFFFPVLFSSFFLRPYLARWLARQTYTLWMPVFFPRWYLVEDMLLTSNFLHCPFYVVGSSGEKKEKEKETLTQPQDSCTYIGHLAFPSLSSNRPTAAAGESRSPRIDPIAFEGKEGSRRRRWN